MSREPDIKINISTVADTAGIDTAQKKVDALQHSADTANATGPAQAVQGNGTAPAQTRQEAEASRLLQQQMRLETQTRRALTAEIRRLNIARKAAAKAGNAEQYAALTKQHSAARQSLEQLNQATAMSTMAMTNQAQTGMMLANSISGLAQQASSGKMTLGGIAGAVTNLGMVMRAGLGPIGLMITALQGLSVAWDWYKTKDQKSAEYMRSYAEKMQEDAARIEAANATLRDLNATERTALLETVNRQANDRLATIKSWYAEAQSAAERQAQVDASAHALRLAALQEELNLADQADTAKRDRLRTLIATEKEAQITAQQAVLEADAERANHLYQDLKSANEKAVAHYGSLLSGKLPDVNEYKRLSAEMAKAENGSEYRRAERKRAEIAVAMDDLLATVQQIEPGFKGGREAAVEWVKALRESAAEQRKQVNEASLAADDVRRVAETQKRILDNELRQEKASAKATAKAEAIALAASERQEQWENITQTKSLDEQEQWITSIIGGLSATSTEVKQWQKQLRAVQTARVAEALNGLTEKYKVSTTYAEKDNRTQAQILAADKRALQARRETLQALAKQTDDVALREQIASALRENASQLRGLAQAQNANRRAAERMTAELKPPKLKAKNKTLQHSLDRTAKAYQQMAQRATAAAKKGDAKSMDRYIAQVRRLGKSLSRASGHGDRVSKQTQALEEAIRSQLKAEKNGKKSAEKKTKAQQNAARASEQAAKASQKEAKQTARNNSQKDISAQSASYQAALNAMQKNTENMASNLVKMTTATQSMAEAAQRTADAASRATEKINAKIDALRKSLDRIARKI